MTYYVDVVAVQIKTPHTRRVMATSLTPDDANAFIKFAVMRRGVEEEFYTTQAAAQARARKE